MIVATACTKWKFEFLSLRSLVLRKESNTSDCHSRGGSHIRGNKSIKNELAGTYRQLIFVPYHIAGMLVKMPVPSAGSGHLTRLSARGARSYIGRTYSRSPAAYSPGLTSITSLEGWISDISNLQGQFTSGAISPFSKPAIVSPSLTGTSASNK